MSTIDPSELETLLPVAPLPRGQANARPPMAQFFLLSLLLHVFFILLFGTPSGGSREGQAMWGSSLNVRIEGPLMQAEPVVGLKLARGLNMSRLGDATPERPSEARESAPPAEPAPPLAAWLPPNLDAEKLQVAPVPLPEPIDAPLVARIVPKVKPPIVPPVALRLPPNLDAKKLQVKPVPLPELVAVPRVARIVPSPKPPVALRLPPNLDAKKLQVKRVPLPEPVVAPRVVRIPKPPVALRLPPNLDTEKLLIKPARLPEPISAPRLARVLPNVKSSAIDQLSPITPAKGDLTPLPRVEVLAKPAPDFAAPMLEFKPGPAAIPALASPVALAPKLAPATAVPAPITASSAPATVPPLLAPPVLAPTVKLTVIAAPALEHSSTSVATPSLAPQPEVAPVAPRTISVTLPEATTPGKTFGDASPAAKPATTNERPALPADERGAARVQAPPAARTGSSRDSPVFDNRTPPAASANVPGMAPRIDLEAARERARDMAREGKGNRALLPFPMPAPPERKTKEQIALEKALKPKCADAYKNLGLLALIPLLANEFGEGSCRW